MTTKQRKQQADAFSRKAAKAEFQRMAPVRQAQFLMKNIDREKLSNFTNYSPNVIKLWTREPLDRELHLNLVNATKKFRSELMITPIKAIEEVTSTDAA